MLLSTFAVKTLVLVAMLRDIPPWQNWIRCTHGKRRSRYLAWEPLRWRSDSTRLASPSEPAGAPQPGRRAAGRARARGLCDRPAQPGAPGAQERL